VFRKNKLESITEELKSLGWFDSFNMYKYGICVFVYMIVHNLVPDYFSNYIVFKSTPYNTKYSNHICVSSPLPIHKYGSDLISVKACNFWNNLPNQLTAIQSLPLFKRNIKHYLLGK